MPVEGGMGNNDGMIITRVVSFVVLGTRSVQVLENVEILKEDGAVRGKFFSRSESAWRKGRRLVIRCADMGIYV
jgi:hypothetical protein